MERFKLLTFLNKISPKKFIVTLGITLLVLVADQITKQLALRYLEIGSRICIIPGFFDLTLTFNKGVAFGVFSDIHNDFLRQAILAVTTVVALVAVLYFIRSEMGGKLSGQIALALILGGAIGNVIDRMWLGQVVDFFLAYYKLYQWPVFNLADSCISVGVVILLIFGTKTSKKT